MFSPVVAKCFHCSAATPTFAVKRLNENWSCTNKLEPSEWRSCGPSWVSKLRAYMMVPCRPGSAVVNVSRDASSAEVMVPFPSTSYCE